jgi:hypothetical protein
MNLLYGIPFSTLDGGFVKAAANKGPNEEG